METKKQSCENCFFALKIDGRLLGRGSSDHQCRRYPPQLQVIPQQNPINGQMEIATAAAYPPVRNENWCGEYKPKV